MLTYLLATLVGLSLGLLGSGGSILAVPILKYTAHLSAKEAVATSLATVGAVSLVGTFLAARERRVLWKQGLLFAIMATVGTFFGVELARHVSEKVQMGAFVLVMGYAVVRMFADGNSQSEDESEGGLVSAIAKALAVGVLTGVVGVGGGFLIVPALVALFGLTMKKATGTSLLVITINSLVGTVFYSQSVPLDWLFTGKFVVAAVTGLFLGLRWSKRVPEERLKRVFAYLLAAVCIYTGVSEFLF